MTDVLPTRALVVFRLPTGAHAELGPGDLIGRAAAATLQLADPRVSEAHALVSLRGERLKLLALRGRFALDGEARREVDLAVGQALTFAAGLVLHVESVQLPDHVLGVEGEGLPRTVLPPVASLVASPQPRVHAKPTRDADAVLFTDGASWTLTVKGASEGHGRPVAVGDAFEAGGRRFELVDVPLAAAAHAMTRIDPGLAPPLTLTARYDTVQIARGDDAPFVVGGVAARLMSELVSFAGPVHWTTLVGELWPHERGGPGPHLRHRLDMTVSRLRRRFRNAGLPSELVRNDGAGHLELGLRGCDKVVDET